MTDCRKPPKGPNWRKDFKDFGVLTTSAAQRKAVFFKHNGFCCKCGQRVTKFAADHVRPLHNIPPSHLEDYPNCLWYWSINNLELLCIPCHAKKSAAERTANAKVKRIIKKRESYTKKSIYDDKLDTIKEKRREYARKQYERAKEWKLKKST